MDRPPEDFFPALLLDNTEAPSDRVDVVRRTICRIRSVEMQEAARQLDEWIAEGWLGTHYGPDGRYVTLGPKLQA